jgi:hypothetical protein
MEVNLDMYSYVGHINYSVWYVLDILYTTNRFANIYEEYFAIWHYPSKYSQIYGIIMVTEE